MTNSMLLCVYFPGNGNSYEFRVPREMKIGQVTQLICSYFRENPEGGYVPDENSMLCDRRSGRILNANLSVAQLEQMDDPSLMFI